jgi:hypothetical protein
MRQGAGKTLWPRKVNLLAYYVSQDMATSDPTLT